MLPWNGKDDNLIDRFDGRALLDFYRLAEATIVVGFPTSGYFDECSVGRSLLHLQRHLACVQGAGCSHAQPIKVR